MPPDLDARGRRPVRPDPSAPHCFERTAEINVFHVRLCVLRALCPCDQTVL